MNENLHKYRSNIKLNMTNFYSIETPPSSSSTSKDSIEESLSLFQSKYRVKLGTTNIGQKSNHEILSTSNSMTIITDEVRDF
jgi:hypothetical protein